MTDTSLSVGTISRAWQHLLLMMEQMNGEQGEWNMVHGAKCKGHKNLMGSEETGIAPVESPAGCSLGMVWWPGGRGRLSTCVW